MQETVLVLADAAKEIQVRIKLALSAHLDRISELLLWISLFYGGDICVHWIDDSMFAWFAGRLCGVCLPNYTMAGTSCVFCEPSTSVQLKTGRIAATVAIVVFFLIVWWIVSLKPLLHLLNAFYFKKCVVPNVTESHWPAFVDVPSDKILSWPPLRTFFSNQLLILDEMRKESRSKLVILVGILKIIITFYQVWPTWHTEEFDSFHAD